jgi:hypothetical protein
VHEYKNVTLLGWGEQFHAPIFVSGVPSVERRQRRRSMILSEICIHISDGLQRSVRRLASDRLTVKGLRVRVVRPP